MLKAKDRELISAFVDGELNPVEKAAAAELIAANAEARQQYDAFLAMRAAVQTSAIAPSPIDIRVPVLKRVKPVRSTARTFRRLIVPFTLAASLFLIVCLASFNIFFGQKTNLAKNRPMPANSNQSLPREEEKAPEQTQVAANTAIPEFQPKTEVAPAPTGIEKLPPPRVVRTNDEITSPAKPDFELMPAAVGRLSLLLPLKDLDQTYPAQRLQTELGHEDLVRIDLFCRDINKAHDQLLAVLKSKGLAAHIEATIPERLKRKVINEMIFFTECLTQAEISAVMQQLAKDDTNRVAKTKENGLFDSFVLIPNQPADVELLSRSMHVPVQTLKLPRKATTVDPKQQQLELNTGRKLADGIKGNSKIVNQFLVVPYHNIQDKNLLPTAKEVKTFLDQRGETKPNSKPLILVLRQL